MAFCTSCGAQVKGAFCEQCGTPASASAGAAPAASGAPPAMTPPPMTPPPAYQAAAPAGAAPVAVARKTSPIVWILVAIFGVFLLVIVGIAGMGFFVLHKAREAGLDPELMRRNPGLAVSKMIAAANPDVTVLNTDDRAGTITVRDRKTGQVTTLNFDDVKNGKFKFSATDESGKTATLEIGGGTGKMPSWVPAYPGAKPEGNFTARGDDGTGKGEGGIVGFSTSDPPSKVLDFYKDKVNSSGLKMVSTTVTGDEGGMIIAGSEDDKRTLQVIIGKSSGGTPIAITFGEKN